MRKPGLPIARGFTLIELMIVIAIVAILAAVAIPSYRDYVMRGYVVDATTLLSSYQAQMERYYQDNRQYTSAAVTGGGTVTPPCATGTAAQRTQGNFVVSCSGSTDLTATSFRLTATGSGPVASFVYTVDQTGIRGSSFPSTATGWTNSTTCWVTKKGQTC